MRITVHELKKTHPCPRFIPTHVGNTSSPERGPRRPAVHPHACGEHESLEPPVNTVTGSSPRMWGTRRWSRSPRRGDRFIPTHVGNTSLRRRLYQPHAVHPHACGEHSASSCSALWYSGSSPRMWGTRWEPRQWSCVRSVHPHACGEHVYILPTGQLKSGSSPRMWGTHDMGFPGIADERFIPTHVGNTRG